MVNTVLDAVAPSHAREHLRAQLSSDLTGAMGAFLDDQTTTVLQATLAGDVVTCANSVSFDTSSTAQVVLTKLRPGPLRPNDIPHAVSVSSMAHSPVSALYHQLRQVYGPLLGNDARGDGAAPVDAKLRGLVAELEAGLGNVLRLTGASVTSRASIRRTPLWSASRRPSTSSRCGARWRTPRTSASPPDGPRTRCTARSNPSRNGSSA